MSKLEIRHPLEKENEFLVLEVTYQLGGTNFATYKKESRGIYLHFTNKTITQHDGYESSQFSLYGDGNCKVLVKELKRKSQKQLDLFFDFLKENKDEFIMAFNNNKGQIFDLINKYNKGKQ